MKIRYVPCEKGDSHEVEIAVEMVVKFAGL
jgi:hypothetical protein